MEIRIGKEAPLQDSTGHGLLTAASSPKRGRMGPSSIFYSAGSSPDPAGFKSAPAYLRTKLSRAFPTTDGGTLRTLAGSRVKAQNRTPSGFGIAAVLSVAGDSLFSPAIP